MAFVRETSGAQGDIYVVDASGNQPVRATFLNTQIGTGVWSSGDQKLIFWANTRGSPWAFDLYSVPASGGTPERLSFSNADAAAPAIDRSANKLACSRCRRDINIWQLKPDSGKPPTKFPASSTRPDMDPEFSPDGSKVAFTSDRDGENANLGERRGWEQCDSRSPYG